MDTDNNKPLDHQALALLLGEVKGQLVGITELIRHSNHGTNQRIDDLGRKLDAQTQAINQRINDHKSEVDERFAAGTARMDLHEERITKLEGGRTQTRVESAGISTLVPVAIEFIKGMFN